MRMMDHLLKAVRATSAFNPEVQAAPVCILWPDRDRQCEVVIPALQAESHKLLILGDYAPDKRMGPSGFVAQSQEKTMMLPFQKVHAHLISAKCQPTGSASGGELRGPSETISAEHLARHSPFVWY